MVCCSYSIAKALAIKNKYELIPNRELRGMHCFTICGWAIFSVVLLNVVCTAKAAYIC